MGKELNKKSAKGSEKRVKNQKSPKIPAGIEQSTAVLVENDTSSVLPAVMHKQDITAKHEPISLSGQPVASEPVAIEKKIGMN